MKEMCEELLDSLFLVGKDLSLIFRWKLLSLIKLLYLIWLHLLIRSLKNEITFLILFKIIKGSITSGFLVTRTTGALLKEHNSGFVCFGPWTTNFYLLSMMANILMTSPLTIFKTACSVLNHTPTNSKNKSYVSFWNWVDSSFYLFLTNIIPGVYFDVLIRLKGFWLEY